MNADASRRVDVGVKAGAELGFLSLVGWGAIISGLIVLSLAALLAVLGIRSRRARWPSRLTFVESCLGVGMRPGTGLNDSRAARTVS